MKLKRGEATGTPLEPELKFVLAIASVVIIVLSAIALLLVLPSLVSAAQATELPCEFTKQMGQHTLCVIYEERAGSLQDLIEWNRRMQSIYVFGIDNEVCFWDRMAENTPEYDLIVTQDNSVVLSAQSRWLIMIRRGLRDVNHLILLPNDGTGPCPVDQ